MNAIREERSEPAQGVVPDPEQRSVEFFEWRGTKRSEPWAKHDS